MTKLLSANGLDIHQKYFQQILIRGDGQDYFNNLINKELSITPLPKTLKL